MDHHEQEGYQSLFRKQHAARMLELRRERKTEQERLDSLKKSLQTKLGADQTKDEPRAA